MENHNTRQYLESIKAQILENLRLLQGAPGVSMEALPDMLESQPPEEPPMDAKGNRSTPEHPAEYFEGPGWSKI